MRFTLLILLNLCVLLLPLVALAQDVAAGAERSIYEVAINQGVPSACLLALVLYYMLVEAPARRKIDTERNRSESDVAVALSKLTDKIDRCTHNQ